VFSFFVAYFNGIHSPTIEGARPGMTDHQEKVATSAEKIKEQKENRKRVFLFVTVFVLTTLVLLTSYRFMIPTRLNDWYLFQAARHTAWVLDRIGEGAVEPEHYSRLDIQNTRASLLAWREGREAPEAEDFARVSTDPLSAWERWSWRAITTRQQDPKRINGPRVYFVLRPGLTSRINTLTVSIHETETDESADDAEKEARLTQLQADLRALREQQQEGAEDTALTFPFILVPECGAIEIMAIFVAAILAFPTLWRKRIIGLVVGIPIMYGVNIFRLTVLAMIGAVDQSRVWFNFAHEYVWQAVYIIFVVAVWLVWVEYVVKRRASS
jgi:exosortase/archaeosortase family protein